MKNTRVRLIMAAALLLFSGFGAKLMAYPTSHGPFPAGQQPATITLNQCKLAREVKPPTADTEDHAGAIREYCLPAAGTNQMPITLALSGSTNGWEINLHDAQGQHLLPGPATNQMTTSQLEVFSCELNGDNQPDFIVNVWSGGCGLAAEGSEVTFLLSGKNSYRATSFYLYDFGSHDLVRFKLQGPVYFIFNDLIGSGGEKMRDGREHNFWVYTLNRIEENRFVPADAEQAGFPKWVWFTTKDNHEETTQLFPAQKTSLLLKRKASR